MTASTPSAGNAFAGVPVSTISDALDRLGITGQVVGIKPIAPTMRVCGPAFTVRMVPAGHPPGTVGDFLDDVPLGGVVVIDNGGRIDVTVWGDLLTLAAANRGVGGAVIDGACRDSLRIRETGFPVFSRAIHMRTGKDRVEAQSIDGPVILGAVRVAPGDIIVGDADGVVVVPSDTLAAVADSAHRIERAEAEIREAVNTGTSLAEARARFGYHELQHRTDDVKANR